jgi:hypothetical protein
MWNWKPAKRVLEALWNHGRLVVADRQGFQRLYDLAERVVPRKLLDAPEPPTDELLRTLAITAVRARGYSVGLEGPPPPPRHREGRRTTHTPTLEESVRGVEIEEYALIDLDRASSYRLNHIGAPVFGPDGEVSVGLFLIGFVGVVPAERVPEYAARLRAACSRVTKAIHGKEPEELAAG